MLTTPTITERMQGVIDRWEAQEDRRAIFLTCYAEMTRNMIRAIDAGEFEDPVWVSALLYRFVDYYFDALLAFECRNSAAPVVWQYTFYAAQKSETNVLKNLLLGINSHICYDLIYALVDLLQPEWRFLSPEMRALRHRDHTHVNEIIRQSVEAVQVALVAKYQPILRFSERIFLHADERIVYRVIGHWRQQVWEYAIGMINPQSHPDQLYAQVEQDAMRRARAILGENGIRGLLQMF
ncbi:MAG: DUF5995 family protein [Anaerolineae bacterium]|nr:DUF5995 family protein [Anaerolineae bacterium]